MKRAFFRIRIHRAGMIKLREKFPLNHLEQFLLCPF